MREICSKVTITTPERSHLQSSAVLNVNFEHVLHLFHVFLLLDFRKQMLAGYWFAISTNYRHYYCCCFLLLEIVTTDFTGAVALTLSAYLKGGKGSVSWQHTQLFRCSLEDDSFIGFDVNMTLKEKWCELIQIYATEVKFEWSLVGVARLINKSTDKCGENWQTPRKTHEIRLYLNYVFTF